MFATLCCWLKHEQIVEVRGCQACLPCLSIAPLTQRLFPPDASGPASAVTQLVDDPDHHKWHPGTLRKVGTGPDFILNVLQLSSYFVNIWVIPVAGPEKSELIGNNDFHRQCSCVFQPQPCVSGSEARLGGFLTLEEQPGKWSRAELSFCLCVVSALECEWSSGFSACSGFLHVVILNNEYLQQHCRDWSGHV